MMTRSELATKIYEQRNKEPRITWQDIFDHGVLCALNDPDPPHIKAKKQMPKLCCFFENHAKEYGKDMETNTPKRDRFFGRFETQNRIRYLGRKAETLKKEIDAIKARFGDVLGEYLEEIALEKMKIEYHKLEIQVARAKISHLEICKDD